jgi:hypothetical protein
MFSGYLSRMKAGEYRNPEIPVNSAALDRFPAAPAADSGPVLAEIYLGSINKWNDPKIFALNPGVNLSNLTIMPVWRNALNSMT